MIPTRNGQILTAKAAFGTNLNFIWPFRGMAKYERKMAILRNGQIGLAKHLFMPLSLFHIFTGTFLFLKDQNPIFIDSPMAQKTVRAQWDDNRDLFAIQHLLRAARQGKKSDTGFKKDVWHELATRFAAKFGITLTIPQFQSRMQTVPSVSESTLTLDS
jgi:hypothetical protein